MFQANKPRNIHRASLSTALWVGIISTLLTACFSSSNTVTAISTSPPTPTRLFATSTTIPTTTPRPTMTTAPTPTLDKVAALASNFNIPSVCLFNYLESKDQNWISADCNLYKELIISDKSSKNSIVIPYQKIDPEASDNFSTLPLNWSGDNRYIYFTTRCCSYDDQSNSNGSLYQYDIEKKELNIFIHGGYKPSYFFSEDGDKLVYFNQYPQEPPPQYLEIGMLEKQSNKSKRIVLKGYWGPSYETPVYQWSKNQEKFAVIIHRLAYHIGGIDAVVETTDIVLRIDFTKMVMELVEKFDPNDILGT